MYPEVKMGSKFVNVPVLRAMLASVYPQIVAR
jgi:hypothetical protein